jgi:hypothetical protein
MAAGGANFPREIEKVTSAFACEPDRATGCVECIRDGDIHIRVRLGGGRIGAAPHPKANSCLRA